MRCALLACSLHSEESASARHLRLETIHTVASGGGLVTGGWGGTVASPPPGPVSSCSTPLQGGGGTDRRIAERDFALLSCAHLRHVSWFTKNEPFLRRAPRPSGSFSAPVSPSHTSGRQRGGLMERKKERKVLPQHVRPRRPGPSCCRGRKGLRLDGPSVATKAEVSAAATADVEGGGAASCWTTGRQRRTRALASHVFTCTRRRRRRRGHILFLAVCKCAIRQSLGVEIVREKFRLFVISKRRFRKNLMPFTFSHCFIRFFCPQITCPSLSRQDSARRHIDLRSARESRAGNVFLLCCPAYRLLPYTPHILSSFSPVAYFVQAASDRP